MPPIRSKKTKQTWNSAEEYRQYAVSKNPAIGQIGLDEIMQMLSSDPTFEILPDPATQAPPMAESPRQFSATNMARNFLPSLGKQAVNMYEGAKKVAMMPIEPVKDAPKLAEEVRAKGLVPAMRDRFTGAVEKTAAIPGQMYDQYKDRYFSGKFLQNLEEDPAAILADAAMLAGGAGTAAKAAGLPKVANVANKVAAVADYGSSPIPYVNAVAGAVPKIADKVAHHEMEASLNFPVRTTKKMSEAVTDYALENKVSVGKKGEAKAKDLYRKANTRMDRATKNAENSGTLIERKPIESDAVAAIQRKKGVTSVDRTKAADAVSEKLSDPDLFGGNPVITPTKAAEIRKNLNASSTPDTGVVMTSEGAYPANVERRMGDAFRSEMKRKIPGYARHSADAMKSKKIADQIDAIIRGQRGSSIVDNSSGTLLGSSLAGSTVSQLGFGAKYLHTPQIRSRASILIHPKNPNQLGNILQGNRKLFQVGGQALKSIGTPDQGRPFDESQDKPWVNPQRPFPE